MDPNHGRFCWYELMTTDTAAAGEFYSKVMGWTIGDAGPGHGDYRLFKPAGSDMGVAGMMPLGEGMGSHPFWVGYIYVEDVDAAAEKVVALGGKVHRPPQDIPGIGRFAPVADPQGAGFVLFKNLPMPSPPPLSPATPGQFNWRELFADDWEKAFDFYAQMFGWTKDMAVDMGPIGTYQLFKTGGEMSAGGMMNRMPNMTMPVWTYYVRVDGADAGAARVVENGGKVLMGPHEVPGGTWIVNCQDPQGGFFNLLSATK